MNLRQIHRQIAYNCCTAFVKGVRVYNRKPHQGQRECARRVRQGLVEFKTYRNVQMRQVAAINVTDDVRVILPDGSDYVKPKRVRTPEQKARKAEADRKRRRAQKA